MPIPQMIVYKEEEGIAVLPPECTKSIHNIHKPMIRNAIGSYSHLVYHSLRKDLK